MSDLIKMDPETGNAQIEKIDETNEPLITLFEESETPTVLDNHKRLMRTTQSALIKLQTLIPGIVETSEAKDLCLALSAISKTVVPQEDKTKVNQNASSIVNQFFPHEPK